AWSFVRDRLVDEVYAFISPKIVGGAGAKTPVGGDGFGMMGDAMPLSDVRVERIGEDILVTGRMQRNG
ncbi:MAG: dihydrofolate reductase family protein, partial [Bacteroidales bacterium]|nr:dihydrofolate reductase family protein [Bacteroidales bacterium]